MGLQMTHEAQAIAAIFPDERHARMAMQELEELGFKRSWMGVIRGGDAGSNMPIVDSAHGGGMFESIGRIFGGEGDRSLHSVLTSHGIPSEQAAALVSRVQPSNAIVTIEVDEVPERAIETLEAHSGDVGRPSGLRTDRNGPSFDSSAVFL